MTLTLVGACSEAVPEPVLSFDGPDSGVILDGEQASAVMFTVSADRAGALDEVVVLHNGDDVTADAQLNASQLAYSPAELADGDHVVVAAREPAAEDAAPDPLHEWSFHVDASPPDLNVSSPDGAVVGAEPVTVAGITEPGATVEAAGVSGTADDEGAFELILDDVPAGVLAVRATDAAGNTTADEVTIVVIPSRVEVDEVRAVHVSFCGWATPSLRDPVLQHIEDGLITAVQLDLKDETGKIGYETQIELAERVGATSPDCRIDLPAAIEQLHSLGVAVIGRIVAFADPVLAPWAWDNDERDWVVQSADGDMYIGRYAGFANFASDDIVDYNLDVAEEAAAAGVDHILWDYVRKPDGPLEKMRFPGLDGPPEERIAEFVRLADERLRPYGVVHGASLYGVSANRSWEVAQDVPALAPHLDYVAPMIYPSHWGPGEYGVADPLRQPHEIVTESLKAWLEVTDDARARVLPWLEDSNWPVRLGHPDRERYVRDQVEATFGVGIGEWMLWDPSVRYTRAAMLQPPGDQP